MDKKYLITVLGATGFTGQLVAEYLAEYCNESSEIKSSQIALAGRSEQKLRKIVDTIAARNGVTFDIVQADAGNAKSIESMVKDTKVVLSTAGPFAKLGTVVVDACVKHSVHYCDITGESPWVGKMIRKYHETAMKNEVLIVSCCGFDSIPSDVGTFMLVDYVRKKFDKGVKDVVASFKIKGSASGGTIHSGIGMIENARSYSELMDSAHPYQLNPINDDKYKPGGQIHFKDYSNLIPFYNKEANAYNGFFVMSAINEKVVRRSNRLYYQAGFNYGDDFHYHEYQVIKSFWVALVQTMALMFGLFLLLIPPVRGVIKRVVLQPGDGPSKELRDKSFFSTKVTGEVEGNGKKVSIVIKGGDPGYGETAKMVSQSALILALQDKQLKTKGGVVTPAFAFGQVIIDRLNKAGISFEVVDF